MLRACVERAAHRGSKHPHARFELLLPDTLLKNMAPWTSRPTCIHTTMQSDLDKNQTEPIRVKQLQCGICEAKFKTKEHN